MHGGENKAVRSKGQKIEDRLALEVDEKNNLPEKAHRRRNMTMSFWAQPSLEYV